jgi:hypothetical protein
MSKVGSRFDRLFGEVGAGHQHDHAGCPGRGLRSQRLSFGQHAGLAQGAVEPGRAQLGAAADAWARRVVSSSSFLLASSTRPAPWPVSSTTTPSASATTRSPGFTVTPPTDTGQLMRPGTSLVGPFGLAPDGVHREAQRADRFGVAHGAVHDDAGDADRHALRHHDLAHQGAGFVALAVDDQHVARLGHRHRGVDHQVVAGAHFDRQRRAGQAHARRQRGDAAAQGAAAAGDVGQDGSRVLGGRATRSASTRSMSRITSGGVVWLMVCPRGDAAAAFSRRGKRGELRGQGRRAIAAAGARCGSPVLSPSCWIGAALMSRV